MRGSLCGALLLLPILVACSNQRVVQSGNQAITSIQSLPVEGPRKRLAIAPLLDRTGSGHNDRDSDISARLGLLTGDDSDLHAHDILSGVRDLLITALFNRGDFIVLEREGLDELLAEQAFAEDRTLADSDHRSTLEGADLLLLGAITAFDTGESGGLAFPIPIPLGDRGDFGLLDFEMRSAYVSMDLRLIEVASGRLVATTAVTGKARKFGIGMSGIFTAGGSHIRLPGLLSLFANTPIAQAMLEMAETAADEIDNAANPALPASEEAGLWRFPP